ncbi:MAG: dipeptide ABC transporter ATP-binding protein [Gammaproteobacteria bacterium]|nr:dipeptide ABC transporter ATP-binding protein [Gammaproteobacteria bacterium]
MTTPLLEVRDLRKHFPIRGGLFRRIVGQVKAVDGVSFTLAPGRTLGLVGESGCGKSTLGRAILQLQRPTSGQVLLHGEDLAALTPPELRARRRQMQIIFQDPYASLNPRRTVGQAIREPLDVHRIGTARERAKRVAELLDVVGLGPAVQDRYPHEFSGGQRQRIGIARALALNPAFIVADEPVSALDVSVQSQVLNLSARLQREHGIAFLFVSHDLAVIQHVSDDIAVMYLGRIVELGPGGAICREPRHPYTQALLSAVPVPDPQQRRARILLPGEIPSPARPPPGCPFHPRCPLAEARCRETVPVLRSVAEGDGGRQVACHRVPTRPA